jgi:hypothetical protein
VHLMQSQYFILLFDKILWLCQEGMKHQMGAATQAQQGMTFQITLIFTFYFLLWEPDPSQNVRTGSVFRVDAMWQAGRFSPPVRTFTPVLMTVSHCPVLTEHWTENRRRFSAGEWEPPKTGANSTDQINSQLYKIVQENSKMM